MNDLFLHRCGPRPCRDCQLKNAKKRIAELEAELSRVTTDETTLTVNILRSWDRQKIERFTLHLLGDEWQREASGIHYDAEALRIELATVKAKLEEANRRSASRVAEVEGLEAECRRYREAIADVTLSEHCPFCEHNLWAKEDGKHAMDCEYIAAKAALEGK